MAERVAEIRNWTRLPIAVGFGISTAEQAREVARVADAIVVGSAIVQKINENASRSDLPARLGEFVASLVAGAKER